jgi:4-amino-4-deoxy-L-arabinose transferase-like glycosyltransferase
MAWPRRFAVRCRVALLLALGCGLIYASISRGWLVYGDDVLLFQVTEAIATRGDLAVTSPHEMGSVARAIRGRDGRGYSKYGIGLSVVALPAYAAGGWRGAPWRDLEEVRDPEGNLRSGSRVLATGLTNAAVGGAAAGVFYLLAIAVGVASWPAALAAVALALASPLAHYAAGFLTEPLSGLCLLLVALGLVAASKGERGWPGALLSGAAAGLAVATKVANLLLVLPAVVWLLWLLRCRRRAGWRWCSVLAALAAWFLPFLAWLGAVAWANWVRFGSVWETGYGAEARNYTTPLAEGVGGLLLSPGRGLLWYWPAAFVALAGLVRLARRAPALAAYAASTLLLSLLLFGRYYQWYGGGSWGPRFLMPVLPLLGPGLALLAERAGRSRPALAAFVLTTLVGLFFSTLLVARPFESQMTTELLSNPQTLAASLWEPASSPLIAQTALLGVNPSWGEPPSAQRMSRPPRWPALMAPLHWNLDIAATRYQSWPLLRWSYKTAATGLAALAAALWLARRPRETG